METREETFHNTFSCGAMYHWLFVALEYKKEYDNTAWWKFCKRSDLKKRWYSARDSAVRENV